jgi:hypothetical protein
LEIQDQGDLAYYRASVAASVFDSCRRRQRDRSSVDGTPSTATSRPCRSRVTADSADRSLNIVVDAIDNMMDGENIVGGGAISVPE